MASAPQNNSPITSFAGLSRFLLPAPPEETTINAELLYHYIGKNSFSIEDYLASLKSMTGNAGSTKYRLFKGIDDEPALNRCLAMRVASPTFRRLAGAVVANALDDSHDEPQKRPDFIDFELRLWRPLAFAGSLVAARFLHCYLGIPEGYDSWLAGHRKRLKMKRGRDYYSTACEPSKHSDESYPVMSPKESVVTSEMAGEIVIMEDTPRAKQICELWNAHS